VRQRSRAGALWGVFGPDSNGRLVVAKTAAAHVPASMDEEERLWLLERLAETGPRALMERDPKLEGVSPNHGQRHRQVALPTLRSARVCDCRQPGSR
jgi:hypothetical protein